MISKSFLKSSIIFTIGGALPMLASIILLPFYTNRLSELHYNQLVFYITITLLSQTIFSLSTDQYFGIRYSQLYADADGRRRFIGTISKLLLIAGFALLLLSALTGELLFDLIFDEARQMEFWPYGFYSILTGFFNAYFKTASICLIYLKRARAFLLSNIINFILTVGISVGGIILIPDSVDGPVYGRLLSGLFIAVYGQYVFSANSGKGADRSILPELFRFCLPYLAFAVSAWVLSNIDRYLLKTQISIADLNAYDLVLKCFVGVEFLQNSLSAVIFPKVYEIWARNGNKQTTQESNRYFNVFTAVNIIQILLFCIVLPLLYTTLIKRAYFYEGQIYIGIIAAGYGLRSIINFYTAAVLFTRKVQIMLTVSIATSVFQVVVTWLAANRWGLTGALYAGLGTRILQALLYSQLAKRIFQFEYNFSKIIVIPALFLLVNVAQFMLMREYSFTFFLLQLGGFSAVFFAIFRNEIAKVLASYGLVRAK